MPTILEQLQTALPGKTIVMEDDGVTVKSMVPGGTLEEWDTIFSITRPMFYRQYKSALDALNIPGWATMTQAEFVAWCDENLMTNAAIDALTLNADLKKNIKGINLFVRNGGKLLIALRNWTRILG
jgi:hypothetical protein